MKKYRKYAQRIKKKGTCSSKTSVAIFFLFWTSLNKIKESQAVFTRCYKGLQRFSFNTVPHWSWFLISFGFIIYWIIALNGVALKWTESEVLLHIVWIAVSLNA